MDKNKLVSKYGFLGEAVIACFTCYARADYNLPLFLFAYILWDSKDKLGDCYIHRFRLTLVFIFSSIIDLVWLIYWGSFWGDDAFDNAWNSGLHTFVIVMSVINFILKLGIIIAICLFDDKVKTSIMPDGLIQHAKDAANVYKSGQ